MCRRNCKFLPEQVSSPPFFSTVCVGRSLVFCVVFCKSLFVLLSFFSLPLHCLSHFVLWPLIISLLSSNIQSLYAVDTQRLNLRMQRLSINTSQAPCGRHVTLEMVALFKYPDVQTKSHVTPAYLVHRLSTETPPYVTGH